METRFKGDPMTSKPSDNTERSLERESIGAGAAGGGALGAVIALSVASSTGVLIPLVGVVIGAAIGGGLGHAANTVIQQSRARAHPDI